MGRRACAALLLAMAIGSASASRLLLANCVDDKMTAKGPTKAFLDANYGERAVASYVNTCDKPGNAACQGKDDGCGLWELVSTKHCKSAEQGAFAQAHGFVYSGTSHKADKHVIGVPCTPVRGAEDIPADKNNAVVVTGRMWPRMWADVTSNSVRADKSGYPADEAALVINTPSFREYHQLHIHAGVRNAQFDDCIQKHMAYAPGGKWQLATCPGLREGGLTTNPPHDAQILYKTVTSLDGLPAAYQEGVAKAPAAGGLTIGGTDTSKYHIGMLVTAPPTKLHTNQWFVVLYAPPQLPTPQNPMRLGRGSFLKGQ